MSDKNSSHFLALYYLSIDWVKVADFLLKDCGYDGWGWEFLFNAVKKNDEGRAIAFLYRKFNTNFRVPDVTDEVEGISPLFEIFWNMKHISTYEKFGTEIIWDFASAQEIVSFFESIDFIAIANHFPSGISYPKYKLSHKRLLRRKIGLCDVEWIKRLLPLKCKEDEADLIKIAIFGEGAHDRAYVAALATAFPGAAFVSAFECPSDIYAIKLREAAQRLENKAAFEFDKPRLKRIEKPFYQQLNAKHKKGKR